MPEPKYWLLGFGDLQSTSRGIDLVVVITYTIFCLHNMRISTINVILVVLEAKIFENPKLNKMRKRYYSKRYKKHSQSRANNQSVS